MQLRVRHVRLRSDSHNVHRMKDLSTSQFCRMSQQKAVMLQANMHQYMH
jgi:hypothetical protein